MNLHIILTSNYYRRKTLKDTALKYKDENNLNYFTETSAKTGFNSKEVFIEAASILYKDYVAYKEKSGNSVIQLIFYT